MDRILKSLLTDFIGSNHVTSNDLSDEFERFVNYSVISHEYGRDFDLDVISVGNGDDTGIDGIAILINGQIVESESEIDDLLESNNYIEATYIFIQSKTSPSFNGSDMHTFGYGVKDFFSETPMLRRNQDIQQFAALSDYLLTKAPSFRNNPKCKLYYVTTGIWRDDQNHIAVIESTKSDLVATGLFSNIHFSAFGGNELSKLYRDTKNSLRATFTFADKVTLPDLPQINEAFYGIIPFHEFRKLLIDDNANLQNIFYDNVRDYQGTNNSTNKDIGEW